MNLPAREPDDAFFATVDPRAHPLSQELTAIAKQGGGEQAIRAAIARALGQVIAASLGSVTRLEIAFSDGTTATLAARAAITLHGFKG